MFAKNVVVREKSKINVKEHANCARVKAGLRIPRA
jgi:hypothetical protein